MYSVDSCCIIRRKRKQLFVNKGKVTGLENTMLRSTLNHVNGDGQYNLQGKHIVVGVTGGIAAYKAVDLVVVCVRLEQK